MSGVEGVAGDGHEPALALVGALHAEFFDALRAVAWYGDGDLGLLYVHSEVDAPDRRLGTAIRRRSVADGPSGSFEYAIDAYEEVVVVTLDARAVVPSAGGAAGIALSVERDGTPLPAITAAIERAVATYRRV
jgi:hypothetical protein